MSPEERIIRQLEALLTRFRHRFDQLSEKHPSGDLRIAAIGLAGNLLHSFLLFMAMVEHTVVHEAWWVNVYGRTPSDADLKSLRNLDSMSRHAFFVFFFSRIEWTLRKLITHVSPGACDNGTATFKSVYDHLLAKLELTEFGPLYDLCRLVRNAVHSNGIVFYKDGGDRRVIWKGSEYVFRHLHPIDFMIHDLMMQLFSDLADSLDRILSHPLVDSIKNMPDAVAEGE